MATAVWAAAGRALSTDPPTAAQIADAVWDENSSDHNSPDTTGNKLNSASAAGDPWTATLSGYGAGSAGKLVYDNLNAPVSSRSSHDAPAVAAAVWSSATRTLANDATLAAIKTQTDKIVAGGATVAHLQPAAEAAILANLGNITADILNGNLASVAAPGNLAGTLIAAAADPWEQTGLGDYAAGSAGRLLADNLNAPVGSRASHTPADAAAAVWSAAGRTLAGDANLAAIKAQTDKIVTGGAAVADLLPAATTAIQNARLHQLMAAPFAAPVAGSLLAGLVEAHAAAWRFTAAALGATPVTTPVIDTASHRRRRLVGGRERLGARHDGAAHHRRHARRRPHRRRGVVGLPGRLQRAQHGRVAAQEHHQLPDAGPDRRPHLGNEHDGLRQPDRHDGPPAAHGDAGRHRRRRLERRQGGPHHRRNVRRPARRARQRPPAPRRRVRPGRLHLQPDQPERQLAHRRGRSRRDRRHHRLPRRRRGRDRRQRQLRLQPRRRARTTSGATSRAGASSIPTPKR
ncbi:MAG: hypothetical protein V9F04_08715 [Dermatophilaceae bacterium]